MKTKPTYQELESENKILRQKLKIIGNNEKFKSYFENNKAIMLQVHPESKHIIDANQAAINYYGYPKTKLLLKTVNDLNIIPPDEISKLMKKALKHKSNLFHFKHRLANDKIRDVEVFASPFNVGTVKYMIVTIHDISQRINAEQKVKKQNKELKQSQFYLKKAQEMGCIGTWELDLIENKLMWTDESYRIFGIPIGTELTYEIFLNCVHPDDREYVNKKWKAALKNEPYDIEHRLIVNNKVKWVREKAEIEFDKKAKAIKSIGFAQDITYKKETEAELITAGEKAEESKARYKAIFNESYYSSGDKQIIGRVFNL